MAAAENDAYRIHFLGLIFQYREAVKRKCPKVAQARLNKAAEVMAKARGITLAEAKAEIFNRYVKTNIKQ